MRQRSGGLLLLLAAVAGADPVEEAADRALAAFCAGKTPDVGGPLSWLVADVLCGRGEHDAAAAVADSPTLRAYVDAQRREPTDPALRKRLAAVIGNRNPQTVLAALGRPVPPTCVTAIRISLVRGHALRNLQRFAEAERAYLAAASGAQELGWLPGESEALHWAGRCATRRSDYRAALHHFERRLALDEERGATLAGQLGDLGIVHALLGHTEKARDLQERALAHYREQEDKAGIARTLGNLGGIHNDLRDYTKALAYHEQALALHEATGDRLGVAGTLTNLGNLHDALGNFAEALVCQRRALEMFEKLGDGGRLAAAMVNTASVLQSLGRYARALSLYERALAEQRRLGDRAGAARSLLGMGGIRGLLGDRARSLALHEEALRILQSIPDPTGAAGVYVNLGNLHREAGDVAKSRACLGAALELAEQVGDPVDAALALAGLARLEQDAGRLDEALRMLERAAALERKVGNRVGFANTLLGVGAVHVLQGEIPRALEIYAKAHEQARMLQAPDVIFWSLSAMAHARLEGGEPATAMALARRAVDAMGALARGHSDELGASARGRFAQAHETGLAAAVRLDDAEAAAFFLESGRAATLIESLRAPATLRDAVLPEALLAAEAAARTRIVEGTQTLRRALDGGVRSEIRTARDELDAARAAQGRVVARIQREAKAAADVLYPRADTLAEIQSELRKKEALLLYGVHRSNAVVLVVSANEARLVALGPWREVEEACRPGLETSSADAAAYVKRLRPLLAVPEECESVLVSPAGGLAFVPFAVLTGDRAVTYVPSGTTYRMLRAHRERTGEKILAVGAPDYGSSASLAPLPASGKEAEAIGDVVLLGARATESGLAAALRGASCLRAVHIACHARFDAQRPSFSALALTPGAGEDGMLTTLDIFRLSVPADLVVLSACQTARGATYRAEGVLGFARAFMFAGAPRVIVSLWKVDDDATRALMEEFYRLWSELPTAAALRRAQEHVAAHERWRHPYYWAAWQLWGIPD